MPMISKWFVVGCCSLLLPACAPTPSSQVASVPTTNPTPPKQPLSSPAERNQEQNLEALFGRELSHLPGTTPVSGRGWSTQVHGRVDSVRPGTAESSENWSYSFEDTAPVDCIVFARAFSPASYVGQILEQLRQSLQLVTFTPTRLSVEGEFPVYFASVFYRKPSPEGPLAGQLKLTLGLHPMRPVACIHDAPGYTETFERVSRALFAAYHVDGATPPTAITIAAVEVGTMPIGFSYERAVVRSKDRIEFSSLSAQIVPRAPTEVMVTDDSEILVADQTSLVEGQYLQADVRGQSLQLELRKVGKRQYRVAGTFDMKPFEATFDAKAGLPSPDASTQALKHRLEQGKPFRFSQPEYRPTLDPTAPIEVHYWRAKNDPRDWIHVGLGQLEMLTTVDEHGEMLRSEMKAGSQSIVIRRLYYRDDRNQSRSSAARQPKSSQP